MVGSSDKSLSAASAQPLGEASRKQLVDADAEAGPQPRLRMIDKSTDAFHLHYFDPPQGLEQYILALFELRYYDEPVDDRHIGSFGQLLLTVRGRMTTDFGERVDDFDSGPILFTAFDVPAPFRATGPGWVLGASLTPYGWAALTQAPVKDHRNRFIPANELIDSDIDRLSDTVVERLLSNELSGEQAYIELADWIRPRLASIPARHEAIIDRTLAWLGSSLNPPVEELFDGLGYSRRQVERLVQTYFGVAPRALARKFRAIRAANLLAEPQLTDEGEAEIASAFVDQPHMIREIRRYCGYTPTRLGGADEPLFIRLINMQNLDRYRPFRAIGKGKEPDGPLLRKSPD